VVVGVMPEGFAFPVNDGLWAPLRLDPSEYRRGEAPAIDVFGRLAPGATLEQAQIAAIGRRTTAAHPATHRHIRPRVLPYTRSFVDSPELMWAFYLMQLLGSLFLVVIAANVAILVYARTATRAGEIPVRLALGASPRPGRHAALRRGAGAFPGGGGGRARGRVVLAAAGQRLHGTGRPATRFRSGGRWAFPRARSPT
jgi:hypothetical protein